MPEEIHSWSVEEARTYLPRLRRLVVLLRKAAEAATRARGNGHSKLNEAVSDDEGAEDGVSAGSARAQPPGSDHPGESPPLITPQQALEEISERGVILRDPSRGLVDFPSRRPSGRLVLLCWQLGEDDLGWWHLPEDGFAGRRPLPVPPEI